MTLGLGTIIRKLRVENNITQENLTSSIGVTPQAISRRESGNGYPDIELLPLLADFFCVSTDELLGYKPGEREEKLCLSVIESCRDKDIRYDAVTTLGSIYIELFSSHFVVTKMFFYNSKIIHFTLISEKQEKIFSK